MTWGCPAYFAEPDVCPECQHSRQCAELVRSGISVMCEAQDMEIEELRRPRPLCPRDYRDVLAPGWTFTSRQLAQMTGHTVHQASVWCSTRLLKGELIVVEQTGLRRRRGNPNVYSYVGFGFVPPDGIHEVRS
jgi:hypothetical protein